MPDPIYPTISDDPQSPGPPSAVSTDQPQPQQPSFVPLKPLNPDSESAGALLKSYNDYRLNGGKDEDLSYDELHNVMSVADGYTTQIPEMQVLTNPDLYFEQVHKPGKDPAMLTDVVGNLFKNPADILSGTVGVVEQGAQIANAAIHGFGDILRDGFTSINPWETQENRDMAGARNFNALTRTVKSDITLVPNLVAGAKGVFDHAVVKAQLDQTTDPDKRDQLDHQLSEISRTSQLREANNNISVANATNDLAAFLNATGIAAVARNLGVAGNAQTFNKDAAQPTENQQAAMNLLDPVMLAATGGAGELMGGAKSILSSVRMGALEKEVPVLNAIGRDAASLAARRAALTTGISEATDDATKTALQKELSIVSASEKQNSSALAAQQAKVDTLSTAVNKQLNDLAPSLAQQGVKMGTGTFASAVEGLNNLVDNVTKVPGTLAERIVGTKAPEVAKAAATETLSSMMQEGIRMLGIHAFAIGGPVGYGLVRGAESVLRMLGNREAMSSIARDAAVIGNTYALGKATLPALQEIAAKTSGLTSAVASMMDRPLIRSLPAQMRGGLAGAAIGGTLGTLQSGGTAQGFQQGALMGGVFGAAGAGHGQLRSYNSPAELRNAAIGDRARFMATMNPDHKQIFTNLRPDTQLAISVFAHVHPDLDINFIHDSKAPNGSHYVSGGRGQITINTAADNPLEAVLTHELAHHISLHGLSDTVNDQILGNPATGHIGLFTHLDENGKPVVVSTTDPLTGTTREAYMPNEQFTRYQSEYNARKLRDIPGATPEDHFGIAQELFAEISSHQFTNREAMQKLIRGHVPSDLINTSAVTNFLADLGLPFDKATGRLMATPEQIQNIQGLGDIVKEYIKGKQFKNHPLEYEDGYSRVTSDAWRSNPDIIHRNLDGAGILAVDPKTGEVLKDASGLPIIRSAKDADKEHAKLTKSILDLIQASPQNLSDDMKGGFVLTTDRNGRQVFRTQNVPDHILQQIRDSNQYNPFQVANWQKTNELTRRDDGSMLLANYNKAVGKGGRYATVEMKERTLVPLYTEVSPKSGQTNIASYDPEQMMKNVSSMVKRKAAQGIWGSVSDALGDVHTYLENLAAGRSGETGIGLQKKGAINAMFGIGTQGNPFIEQFQTRFPSVFKTFRLDRMNKAREVTGVTRPVYGQTYEQVRAFMQPRAAAVEEPIHPDAIPVTMRTTKSGKEEPVPIDYNLTHTPLVADKAPPQNLSGENNFGHVKFLTAPDQQRLTHMDKASAVTDYADKLVSEYDRWKTTPEVMDAKGWYDTVLKHLKKGFGGDKELFAQLLSATSPQNGVVQNFKDALEAYRQYRNGAYDGAIREFKRTGKVTDAISPRKANGAKYGFNSDAVLKVLADQWLQNVKGPKTPNFFRNLFQRGTDATIDMWAARTMHRLGHEGVEGAPAQWRIQPKSEDKVSNLDFAFSQEAFKQAADRLGMKPHQLQAILWYGEKMHYAQKGYTKGGASAALASFIPQLKEYAANPEFAPTRIDTRLTRGF